MMLPSRSVTSAANVLDTAPRLTMSIISTPGAVPGPTGVTTLNAGATPAAKAPVVNVLSVSVRVWPVASLIVACMWYVVAGRIPATSTVVEPPPFTAGCAQVVSPYAVVVPKFTCTVEACGTVTLYEATSGLLVGATVPGLNFGVETNETVAGGAD